MTTSIRRAWLCYDTLGRATELRVDFTDKLADFHISVPISDSPQLLVHALMNAGHALAIELHHKGESPT